tara:strand:- start:1996 stop:2703 length:708 start_codon:yes stop_codon:yes gene_type:complete
MAAQEIDRQIANVRELLSERPQGLQEHVGRVLEEAFSLAKVWDVSKERIELAVIGHDLFRAVAPEEQIRFAEEAGLKIQDEFRENPILLHGPLAANLLATGVGVTDSEVLIAIKEHTSGYSEMSLLAKILVISDKVELVKRRDVFALKAIRYLAARDLDMALLCWADWKWVKERQSGWPSIQSHWEVRFQWMTEHHKDIAMPKLSSFAAFERAAKNFPAVSLPIQSQQVQVQAQE